MSDTDDKIKKAGPVVTDRGVGRDLSQPTQYTPATQTSYTGQGADWFGPLQPMEPVAPKDVAGRALDYVPGYNLTTQPRYYEPVDFRALRSFADAYDPLRLVIERRKDQLCRLPWSIRPKTDGMRRPKVATLSASARERIRDIEAFFKRPDYELSFRSWLRSLLEDLFVIDAATIYCERTPYGQLVGLQVVDGATVKKVIGPDGRMPRPIRWTGASFIWSQKEVTAANYEALGFKVYGSLIYPPAFQQVLHGLPAVSLSVREIIQRPFNPRPNHIYGMSCVEQIMTTISTAMRRAQSQLEYYREGNEPAGLYSLPSSWTPDNVQRFQDYWDSLHSGHLGQRRKIRFLAGDGKYQALHEPPLKNEFDEWIMRVICFAFSYPVTAFVHQVNRATAEQHEAQAEKEGLEPIKNWFSDIANEIVEREFNADDLEFVWGEENDIDPKKQAEVLSTYVDSGMMSLNEARERLGEEPSPDPMASVLAVKTATGRVPISAVDQQQQETQP